MMMVTIFIASVGFATRSAALIRPNKLAIDATPVLNISGRRLSSFATMVPSDMLKRLPRDDAARMSRISRFNILTKGTDVIICTDKAATDVVGFFENVIHVSFAEDMGGIPQSYFATITGERLIQWWRFKNCYESLQRFASQHQHEYSFIMKARVDVDMVDSVEKLAYKYLADVAGKQRARPLAFIASDYAVGGSPEVMSTIAKLHDEVDKYTMAINAYKPLDYDWLFENDWSAGKFDCLQYPLESLGNICKLSYERRPAGYTSELSNLRSILQMNISGLKSAPESNSNGLNVCEGCWGSEVGLQNCRDVEFETEKGLLMHLMNHGILVKSFGTKFTFYESHVEPCKQMNKRTDYVMRKYFSNHCQ